LLAMPSMALAVMERSLGNDVSYPLAPMMRRLSVGAVAAMIGAAIFFIAFPRLSWNVAARRPSRGLGAVTGISEGIRLGGAGGEIKRNPRVVARVELSPDPKKDRLEAYWVVATWGTWTGREWTDDTKPGPPNAQVRLGALDGKEIRQRIELLPAYGAPMAVAMETPVMFAHSASMNAGGRRPTAFVHAPGRDVRFADAAPAHTYVASSRSAGAIPYEPLDEETLARYRALPDVDQRVAELAGRIVGDSTDPLEAARKLETWLRQNLTYTLDLPDTDDDPLAHFLFERRSGHCEYFASALAVMLRTRGFASRVATGFFGGERLEDGYVLRAGDAHAWVQVWVPGRGFVSLDATPPAGRAAQPIPWLDWVVRAWDQLDALWRAEILDYSMRDQVRAVMKVTGSGSRTRLSTGTIPRNAWIAAAVVALVVYAVWRLRGVKRSGRAVHEATLLREEAERILAHARIAPEEGEGLEGLRRRLARQGHPLSAPVDALTRRYLEARFGTRPLRTGERAHVLRRLSDAVARLHRAA
ncbi:MAG: transglutaminase domain-containing protein, partial [Myxococcaceae bacterium]